MSNARLETLIWALIYGGLLMLCLALFVAREGGHFAWTLGIGGAAVTLVGALLIVVRARRDTTPP